MITDKAIIIANKLLARRSMSCQELNNALIGHNISPETAADTIAEFSRLGLVNDVEYATALVRRYCARLHGKTAIRMRLKAHGISDDDIRIALADWEPDYEKLCQLLVLRLGGETDYKTIQRGNALLYRRGFSSDEIRHALSLYTEYAHNVDALDDFDGYPDDE